MADDLRDRLMEAMEGVQVDVGFTDQAGDDGWAFGTLDSDSRAELVRWIIPIVRAEAAHAWDAGFATGFYKAQTIHNTDPERELDASEVDVPNPWADGVRNG